MWNICGLYLKLICICYVLLKKWIFAYKRLRELNLRLLYEINEVESKC